MVDPRGVDARRADPTAAGMPPCGVERGEARRSAHGGERGGNGGGAEGRGLDLPRRRSLLARLKEPVRGEVVSARDNTMAAARCEADGERGRADWGGKKGRMGGRTGGRRNETKDAGRNERRKKVLMAF